MFENTLDFAEVHGWQGFEIIRFILILVKKRKIINSKKAKQEVANAQA